MKNSFQSLSVKILIAFVLICFSFFIAWKITSNNYDKIRNTVKQLSAPQKEQALINQLFKDIIYLDQIQKSSLANSTKLSSGFTDEVKVTQTKINLSIDSLLGYNVNNGAQIKRINEVVTLLDKRAALMQDYLLLQKDYLASDSLKFQLDQFSQFVQTAYLRADSNRFKTESKISATTLTDTLSKITEDKSGFWNRLFGKKKEPVVKEIQHFILEQLNVAVDSIQLIEDDSIYNQLSLKIQKAQNSRNLQLQKLNTKRTQYDITNATLYSQLFATLNSIETDGRIMKHQSNTFAEGIINSSLSDLSILLWIFIIVIFVLCVFIFLDIHKNNRYKVALEIANQQAAHLSKLKQDFLSTMSHELRSPLQTVVGFAEMLKKQPALLVEERLAIIEQSSRHLLDVVNNVLDYNKLNEKDLELNNAPIHLSTLLQELYNIIILPVEQKQLHLQWEVPSDMETLTLEGDAIRLKQIILNLLHNAIKFTDEGTITLRLYTHIVADECILRWEISDTGQGIPEEGLHVIFQPFEQIHPNIYGEGTGLGLSIVRQLVNAFNGTIKVTSKLNVGSDFFVELTLPLYEGDNSIAHEAATALRIDQPFTVWIVDDDPLILKYYEAVLQSTVINYILFNDVEDVLNAAVTPDLKFVLTDIRMPKLSGYELMAALKASHEYFQSVQFVAATAQVLPDEIKLAKTKGFHAVLKKPFSATELLQTLTNQGQSYMKEDTAFVLNNEMIDLFTTEMHKDIVQMQDYVMQGDEAALNFKLHIMATRLGQLSYKDLAQEARTLEMLTQSGQLPLQRTLQFIKELESRFKL